MTCESCHSKDEEIRELRSEVYYLRFMLQFEKNKTAANSTESEVPNEYNEQR